MTSDRTAFVTYSVFPTPQTIHAAKKGSSFLTYGQGSLLATMTYKGKSHKFWLNDVLFTPSVSVVLLSIRRLKKISIHAHLAETDYLSYQNQTISDQDINGLFVVSIDLEQHFTHIVTSKRDITQPLDVWHCRLGHISQTTVKNLVRTEAVQGIQLGPDPKLANCECCLLGKHANTESPPRSLRCTVLFDVIYCDIEYMINMSFSGAVYSLKFVDEASGYTWFYAVASKDADIVLSAFRKLDTFIQTQFSKRVQHLQTDNGREFVNRKMSQYLNERGIEHRTSAPGRHEMNGIAERINRTVSNLIRCMIFDSALDRKYWAEVSAYAVYILNRVTHSFLPAGMTPYFLLFCQNRQA